MVTYKLHFIVTGLVFLIADVLTDYRAEMNHLKIPRNELLEWDYVYERLGKPRDEGNVNPLKRLCEEILLSEQDEAIDLVSGTFNVSNKLMYVEIQKIHPNLDVPMVMEVPNLACEIDFGTWNSYTKGYNNTVIYMKPPEGSQMYTLRHTIDMSYDRWPLVQSLGIQGRRKLCRGIFDGMDEGNRPGKSEVRLLTVYNQEARRTFREVTLICTPENKTTEYYFIQVSQYLNHVYLVLPTKHVSIFQISGLVTIPWSAITAVTEGRGNVI